MKKLSVIFILAAPLMAQQQQSGGDLMKALLPLIFIFVIFYLLLIYPQSRAEKKRKAMLNALKKGDRVITSGGIIGTVQKIDNNIVSLKVAQNTVIKIDKSAIRGVLGQETEEKKKADEKK